MPLAIAGIGAFTIYNLKLSSSETVIGLSLCLFLGAVLSRTKSTNVSFRSIAKRAMIVLSVVFLVTLLLAPNVQAAAITEYYLPPGSTQPYGITFDNLALNVWFAEFGSSRIGRKTSASSYTDTVEFQLLNGSKPIGIGYESDTYRVWFTESSRNQNRCDFSIYCNPSSYNLTEYVLENGAVPHGMDIQPNANKTSSPNAPAPYIWFAEYGRHAIAMLDMNYTTTQRTASGL